MRTAICISGQPRCAKEGYEYLKTSILDRNENCDIFVHAWIDHSKVGQRYHFGHPALVLPDTDKMVLDLYKPVKHEFELQQPFDDHKYDPGPYGDSCPNYMIFTVQSMFYGWSRVNAMRKAYEEENKFQYDCVVRIRFDLALSTPFIFSEYDLNSIWCKNCCMHEPGCMNDHFAFSNRENMDVYLSIHNHLDEATKDCPFCPEVVLGRYFKLRNVPVTQIPIESYVIRG